MANQFYSKAHYDRLSNGAPDKPGQAEDRIRYRKAAEQANIETMARFMPLTANNAQDAIDWQENRIKELLDSDIPKG